MHAYTIRHNHTQNTFSFLKQCHEQHEHAWTRCTRSTWPFLSRLTFWYSRHSRLTISTNQRNCWRIFSRWLEPLERLVMGKHSKAVLRPRSKKGKAQGCWNSWSWKIDAHLHRQLSFFLLMIRSIRFRLCALQRVVTSLERVMLYSMKLAMLQASSESPSPSAQCFPCVLLLEWIAQS